MRLPIRQFSYRRFESCDTSFKVYDFLLVSGLLAVGQTSTAGACSAKLAVLQRNGTQAHCSETEKTGAKVSQLWHGGPRMTQGASKYGDSSSHVVST